MRRALLAVGAAIALLATSVQSQSLLLLGSGRGGSSAAGTPAIVSSLVVAYELDEASGNAIDAVGTSCAGGSACDLTETSGTIAADAGSGGCGPARAFVATDSEYFA